MPTADSQVSERPQPTVFLSYASEDRAAVQRIRDALPDYGMEVWYDESDLLGGDAWDQKIRRQIRDCHFFMPVISARTEARREGYFRREWRLAAERTLDMADDSVFLVPVCIDDTSETHARVPDKFRAVQWTRVPDGRPNAALEGLCRRLVSDEPPAPPAARAAKTRGSQKRAVRQPPEFPPFPREEPGQKSRFWLQVVGWVFQWAWAGFRRFPKWVRLLAYFWIAILLLQWGSNSSPQRSHPLSAKQAQNLAQIVHILKGESQSAPLAASPEGAAQTPSPGSAKRLQTAPAPPSVLAISFTAPPADPHARQFARTVFREVYGGLRPMLHGRVALDGTPLPALDAAAAVKRARAHHSSYVVYGGIDGDASKRTLTVKILTAAGRMSWSRSYPLAGARPARIAAQVVSEVERIERDRAT